MTETNGPSENIVIIDHIFRPYCSGFNMLRLLTSMFENVEVRRFNVNTLDQHRLAELPRHIETAVKGGEPRTFGGEFYVNGRLIASNLQALEEAVERAGGVRLSEVSTWHHPLPKLTNASEGLLVRRVTVEDIEGTGEALPSFWCDLNGDDPEVKLFLSRMTKKHGCCMAGAYVNGEVCGFVSFLPAETKEIPGAHPVSDGSLRVVCLHVFPFRRRQGIATALLGEVISFAREKGYRKILSFAGYTDIDMAFKGTPAGSRSVYNKLGFKMVSCREPNSQGDEGEAAMELLL